MGNNTEKEGITIITTQGALGETKVFILNAIVFDTRKELDKNEYNDFKIIKTEHRYGKILK